MAIAGHKFQVSVFLIIPSRIGTETGERDVKFPAGNQFREVFLNGRN